MRLVRPPRNELFSRTSCLCAWLTKCRIDTRLADRSGKLEKERAEAVRYAQGVSKPKATHSPQGKKSQGTDDGAAPSGLDPLLAATQDLAAAQKSREDLSNKLEQALVKLDRLTRKLNAETQRAADLAVERTQLQIRLKDRDEELRGKAKLLDVSSDIILVLGISGIFVLTLVTNRMSKTSLCRSICSSIWLRSDPRGLRKRINSLLTDGWQEWDRKRKP